MTETRSQFDTELTQDDMREEVRKMFETIALWVELFSVKNICPLCHDIVYDNGSGVGEVYDWYIAEHLWGMHKWTEVVEWLSPYIKTVVRFKDNIVVEKV